MTTKVFQIWKTANRHGVTQLGKFVGCKVKLDADGYTRFRTVNGSGTISIAANAGIMQRIHIDVDEYGKHYPDADVTKTLESMYGEREIIEVN